MDPAGGGPGSGAGPDCHRGLGVPGHGLGRTYRAGAPLPGGQPGKERVLERYLFRPAHRVLCGVFPQRQRSAHGGLRLQGYRPGNPVRHGPDPGEPGQTGGVRPERRLVCALHRRAHRTGGDRRDCAGHRLLQRHLGHRLQRRRHRFHRPQRAVCLRVLRRAGRKAGRRHQ